MICLQVLANEAMKPAKLKRHLGAKHPDCAKKSRCYFKRKGEEYRQPQPRMIRLTTIPAKAQRASYLVAQRIAKAKKPPHNWGGTSAPSYSRDVLGDDGEGGGK